MEERSERSMARVDTLMEALCEVTKGASEVLRRDVLRARRMMCDMGVARANWAAIWSPIPGPAPKTMRVRGGAMVGCGCGSCGGESKWESERLYVWDIGFFM